LVAIDGGAGSGVRYDWDGDIYVSNDGKNRSAAPFGAGLVTVVKMVLDFGTRKFEFLLDEKSQVNTNQHHFLLLSYACRSFDVGQSELMIIDI
jgi:hypothetical protein